jgi:hypothetical protein
MMRHDEVFPRIIENQSKDLDTIFEVDYHPLDGHFIILFKRDKEYRLEAQANYVRIQGSFFWIHEGEGSGDDITIEIHSDAYLKEHKNIDDLPEEIKLALL